MIVRLANKKKTRELTYAGGTAFNFRSGVDTDDLIAMDLTPTEGGGYTLRPKVDLKPGEYLIAPPGTGIMGYGPGYDFGITK